MKNISIIGSTGSIGRQTLEIVQNNPRDYNIIGLTCNQRIDILEEQIELFNPLVVCVMNEKKASELKRRLKKPVDILVGLNGLVEVAAHHKNDMLLTSVVGSIGLMPTYRAIEKGIDIALANKETLVTAGEIIIKKAKETGSRILPVDSEHSAIFQAMQGEENRTIEKIILTASGGSFREYSYHELKDISVKEALNHPNWSMGKKITIDSATMMNKGLEVIEAKWLFDVEPSQIDVVIHPESIIHSMVQFIDGSIISQMGLPDMKLPIHYAMNYPTRVKTDYERLDLLKLKQLNFKSPHDKKYKCLELAYEALKIGGTMPVVLNKVNEIAVDRFLNQKIKYLEIPRFIEQAMQQHKVIYKPALNTILKLEDELKERYKL